MNHQDQTFFELQSSDSSNPCCYIDGKTYELLYMNHAMLSISENFLNYQGKTCYDVIPQSEAICQHCAAKESRIGSFVEANQKSELNGKIYRVQSCLFHLNGRDIYFCKYFLERQDVQILQWDCNLPTGMTLEQAMSECAKAMSEKQAKTVCQRYLDVLGRYYRCDRVAMFDLSVIEEKLCCTYEWALDEGKTPFPSYHCDPFIKKVVDILEEQELGGLVIFERKRQVELEDPRKAYFLQGYQFENMVGFLMRDHNNLVVGYLALFNVKALVSDFQLFRSSANFLRDNQAMVHTQQEISALSDLDSLTGIYNSGKYAKDIHHLENSYRGGLGVIFVSINGLKMTNEYFGYEAGDAQIQKAMLTLREFIPETWYRVGGGDFVCLFTEKTEEEFQESMEALLETLKESNNTLFTLGQIWSGSSHNMGKLVADANAIMYINQQALYSQDNQLLAEITDKYLKDLLTALHNEEFLVYLQGKFDLQTGKIKGAEALIRRYDKKEQQMIFPDQFIPHYEANSIIRHVDLFVLEQVCKLLKKWEIVEETFTISVNLSRVTLLENNIVETISGICDKWETPHHFIVIELTERVGVVENNVPSKLVDTFREHGFKLSLDDFGCAYSNLVTLAQVPFDEVKLDKSLVDEVLTNKKNSLIVQSIVSTVNKMDDTTSSLAEGIETREQADCLREFGCQYGQGYLFSRPIPHEEFYEKFLKA